MTRGTLWTLVGARTRRGMALLWAALLVFSLIAQSASFTAPAPALAAHNEDLFELDGNALNQAAVGEDWDTVYGGTSTASRTFFAEDPYEDDAYTGGLVDDTYTGGSTKDDIDFPSWLWKYFKASQAKNDITHAFAATYDAPDGDVITYFGLAKYEADGNNYAGFWFLKDDFGRPAAESGPNGTPFNGEHVVGDILVLANYTNGGEIADFDIFKWVGTGGDANAAGTLETVASGVPCAGGVLSDDACGATNAVEIDSPWSYQGRDSNGNPIDPDRMPPATFFEGGINLTALELDEGCFSSFVAETRSSQSVDATLTDFVTGSFSFCVTPEIRTQVQQDDENVSTVDLSESFYDHVEISGNKGLAEGTVDIYVCGPTETAVECDPEDGTLVSTETLSGGMADSDDVTPTESGFYCFYVEYTPAVGSKYLAESHANATTECVEVLPPDVEIVKTAEDDSINAGDEIAFTVTITNNGTGNAFGAEVDDELPAGFDWMIDAANSDTGWSIDASNHLVYGPATLAANGGTSTVRIYASTDADDCGNVVNQAFLTITNGTGDDDDATVDILCADIDVEKSTENETISAGDTIDFEVTITNNGEGDAYGAELSDELPAGFDWSIDAANSDAGFSIVDDVLSWGPDTLPAGESRTVRITSPTDADDCGEVENVAYVTTTNDGSDNDNATVTIECPDVQVVKEAVASPVSAGDEIAFDITVSNVGDGDAYDVELVDQLPDGIEWSENSDDCSITGTGDDQVLSCDFGTILAGADPITVRVSGTTSAEVCGEVPNTAQIAASNEPQTPEFLENNEDGATVTVECPDVKVEKKAVASPVNAGDEIAFDITVSNLGPGDAYDVTLEDELPDGIEWSENSDDCSITGTGDDQVLSCDFDTILAGADPITVRVSGETDAADCAEIPNTATVDASNEPNTAEYTENNEDSDSVLVECADIVLTKTADDPEVLAGDLIGFVITVTNNGAGAAYGTLVEDVLPTDAGLSWWIDGVNSDEGWSIVDGKLTWGPGTLGAGESISVHIISNTTAATCGDVDNEAFVTTTNDGSDDDASEVIVYCPDIDIVKTAGDAADGEEYVTTPGGVIFTYVVTNTGTIDLVNVVVVDDNATPADTSDDVTLDCPKDALAAGEQMTCTATLPVDFGVRTNIAEVIGNPSIDEEVEVSDEDDAVVRVPDLTIEKSFTGNTGGTTPGGDPEAKEGDLLTYTLAYDLTDGPVTNGVITDTLPLGLIYVEGSATGNDEFSFVSWDAATRKLTWTAATVTADGTVTYKVTVATGAAELIQPLINVATIDSDETNKDDDDAKVFVEPPPLAETATPNPTLPPTTTIDQGSSQPGPSLLLVLAVLAGVLLAVGYMRPTPARASRRIRRDR